MNLGTRLGVRALQLLSRRVTASTTRVMASSTRKALSLKQAGTLSRAMCTVDCGDAAVLAAGGAIDVWTQPFFASTPPEKVGTGIPGAV